MFTVLHRNHLLKSGVYRGTFGFKEAAIGYAKKQAKRSRSFVDFEVFEGTPRNPGKPTGDVFKGEQ